MALPTYYTYQDPYPATLNDPNAVQLETRANWPKLYSYNSSNYATQGIHPPAPVYNAQQQVGQSWYYNGQQAQGGYYANGQYYPAPTAAGTTYSPSNYYYYQPSTSTYFYNKNWFRPSTSYPFSNWPHQVTGYAPSNNLAHYYKNFQVYKAQHQYPCSGLNPYSYIHSLAYSIPNQFPAPGCPGTLVSQAAQAAANNAALAAMPQAPNYFVGQTPAEIAMQQTYFAQTYPGVSMPQQLAQWPKPPPTQLAPYKPADGQQFWCKESDGSWTLRTHSDIINGDVSPGHWERHQTSGYFYWVRDG